MAFKRKSGVKSIKPIGKSSRSSGFRLPYHMMADIKKLMKENKMNPKTKEKFSKFFKTKRR